MYHRRQFVRLLSATGFLAVALTGVWPPAIVWGAPTDQQVRYDQAQQHFEQGRQAYQSGDLETARQEFIDSLSLLESGRIAAPTATDQVPLFDTPVLDTMPRTAASSGPSAIAVPLTTQPVAVAPAVGSGETPPVFGDALAGSPPPAAASAVGMAAPYLIAVGDLLHVSVWQVDNLSRDVAVRPDGKISYPLAGDLPAEGMTLTELRQLLTDRLKLYVREPQVTVELKGMAQQRIVILGEVNKQGLHAFPGRNVTVPEALALAEGFKRIGAKVKDVAVLKGYPHNPQLYHIDVKTLFSKGEDPQRLVLTGGDIIYVSRTWIGSAHAFLDATTPILNSAFQGLSTYALYDTIVTTPKP